MWEVWDENGNWKGFDLDGFEKWDMNHRCTDMMRTLHEVNKKLDSLYTNPWEGVDPVCYDLVKYELRDLKKNTRRVLDVFKEEMDNERE